MISAQHLRKAKRENEKETENVTEREMATAKQRAGHKVGEMVIHEQ